MNCYFQKGATIKTRDESMRQNKTYLQLFPYEQLPLTAQFLQKSEEFCVLLAIAGLVPNLSKTLGRRESILHFVVSTVIFLIFDFDILSP